MASVQTLVDVYLQGIDRRRGRVAFRRKQDGFYRDVPMEEFARAGTEIALGLIGLGLSPGDRVAILSETRLEWAQADMGILTAALISVPIYPTLTHSTVEYVLEDSGARVILAADPGQLEKLEAYRASHPELTVVVFDPGENAGDVLSLDGLRERGRRLGEERPGLHRERAATVKADDLATVIYTSGTTGPPKGVMLTHRNILSNVEDGLQVLSIGESDTALSFLPLSHILERMAGLYCMFHAGATVAYAESFDTVAQNMIEARPTIMVSVPRLYEKIYARVMDNAVRGGWLKKQIFFWARGVGLERARRKLSGRPIGGWLEARYRLAVRLVFSKLVERTGGRLRFFISGGAPLSPEIAEFFYAAGLPILEGYGLTESSPVLAVNTFEHLRLGTVGRPLPRVEIEIAEDGEILARGPNVMPGYYNMPEATAEALAGGRLHTGDIGHVDGDGYLVITDRKKDLIVTAGGKNVAPQPIENALKTDKYIAEAVVLGDRRPYLVALIVPSFDNLERYARYKGLDIKDRSDLVANERVRDLMRRRLARHQRDAASYETIKRFLILDRELTVEAGELTPTLKVKRKEITERFSAEIEQLYAAENG